MSSVRSPARHRPHHVRRAGRRPGRLTPARPVAPRWRAHSRGPACLFRSPARLLPFPAGPVARPMRRLRSRPHRARPRSASPRSVSPRSVFPRSAFPRGPFLRSGQDPCRICLVGSGLYLVCRWWQRLRAACLPSRLRVQCRLRVVGGCECRLRVLHFGEDLFCCGRFCRGRISVAVELAMHDVACAAVAASESTCCVPAESASVSCSATRVASVSYAAAPADLASSMLTRSCSVSCADP